jgi:quinol monooxygenase YgiN
MVTVIFDYDVAAEKQAEYLRVTKEKIKPLWESIGCKSYDVWQQTDAGTRFVKIMIFDDMSRMKETMANQAADPAKKIFGQFAENVSRRICEKRT